MSVGGNIAGAIADGLKGAVGMVTGAAEAVAGAISDAFGAVADAAMGIGSKIARGVADGLNGAKDMVTGAASGVAGAIGGALPGSDAEYGPLSNLTQTGPAFINTLADGIRSPGYFRQRCRTRFRRML
jgi:phage-related protein